MISKPGQLKPVPRGSVSLRPLSMEDAPLMFQWMSDPVIVQNVGIRADPSLEKTKKWIADALCDPAVMPYAIIFDGCHVGNIVLDRIDTYLGTARMSIYLGEAAKRGCGIGSAALSLVLAEGFNSLGLYKIWLTVHCRNYSGINSYTSLGFRLEGILRGEFMLQGQRLDAFYMGILKSEFQAPCSEGASS